MEGLKVALAAFLLAFAVFSFAMAGLGLYLAFKASILLGIIVLLVEPAPSIIGVVYLFTGTDLAHRIMEWLTRQ